jgi:hypothetical protein
MQQFVHCAFVVPDWGDVTVIAGCAPMIAHGAAIWRVAVGWLVQVTGTRHGIKSLGLDSIKINDNRRPMVLAGPH